MICRSEEQSNALQSRLGFKRKYQIHYLQLLKDILFHSGIVQVIWTFNLQRILRMYSLKMRNLLSLIFISVK